MSHVVSLVKGANVNLSKIAPAMIAATIGLGWVKRVTDGTDFDLDASLFLLNEQGVVESAEGFVYYRNPASPCGSVNHKGDNRTGEGEGDDETIAVQLDKIPDSIKRLAVVVSIHDGVARGQSFGQVSDAYIRVMNDADGEVLTRYDLSEDASMETAMVLGELYRHGDDWKFKAIGQGYKEGLAEAMKQYGISAS
ncbi:General stress protein 16U [compost metagenome]